MALNYLLDPAFEMVNTAGKPATGGKINVFVHGTRDKYYCASDFNGTLLPFDIPLDSLGSAVILADDSQAYDVYIYNRYGTLMMSRYNVQPKSGGGVSVQSITSTDGSITVTDTAGGVDLSVNGATPSVLRASGDTLTSDGSFTCTPLQQTGNNVIVDQNGKVKVEHGWYHYDIVTHFDYSGTPTNQTVVIALRHGGLEYIREVDLSYPNEGTIALSAETYNPASGLEEFDISVSGIPVGMSVELVELGIHSIHGHGAGATYTAGNGITIQDDEISIDTDVVATKTDLESKQDTLTAGDNISIVDNVISATAAPQVNADWDATSGVSEILNKPNLATVATTGDYSDLQNLPSIPAAQINSDWSATSGVAQILNKPTIPTATSDLTNDTGYITLSDVPAQVNADWDATSGVSEILNKPTIPSGAQLVPSATSADVNKVLTVNAQGTPAWANSSGGNEVYVTWDDTSAGWSSMWTQVQAALSANKEVYIKDGFCVAEVIGVYDGQVNFRGLSDNHFGSPPKMTYNYYVIQQGFAYKEVHAQYVLPNPSSGSVGQVLGLVSSSDPPYREPAWVNSSGGGSQVNSDWDATSGVAEILNKPTPKTLTAGANISISEGVGTLTISAAAGLPASTSADEGKCLVVDSNGDPEWGTGGKTYTGTDGVVVDNVNDTVGLEAPVDLVAGPGISIDNPDGNTVRISYSGYNETLLWSSSTAASTFTLSEIITNFERLKILMRYNGMNCWCDGTIVSAAQFTVACCGYANNSGDGNRLQVFGGSFTSSDGKSFASEAGKCIYFSNGNAAIGGGATAACTFLKIYGVNRIANN